MQLIDCSTLALLAFKIKKQKDEASQTKYEKEFQAYIDQVEDASLGIMFAQNALYAEKMGAVVQASAVTLYTQALTDKNRQDELLTQALGVVEDATIWESIAAEFNFIAEEVAEESEEHSEEEE